MTAIKTHKFKNGQYNIEELHGVIYGLCDVPGDSDLTMVIPEGNTQRSLKTAVHEALHANGLPARYLDEGHDVAEEVGRFLWRLGWRRSE